MRCLTFSVCAVNSSKVLYGAFSYRKSRAHYVKVVQWWNLRTADSCTAVHVDPSESLWTVDT